MIYGGSREHSEHTDQYYNQLHVFDFSTLCWVEPPMPFDSLGYRRGHMAVCHNDALIVLGGEPPLSLNWPVTMVSINAAPVTADW